MRSRAAALALFLLGLVVGCGDSGPPRLRLSGAAKFDGEPIMYGDVVFTPDGAKGHSGPQGFANIRGTGFTGEGGKLICEYEWSVDLPTTDGNYDINVPKAGAAGAKKGNPDI